MAFTFTDSNVEEIIASGQLVVIDCWATWCGPCKAMAPDIDKLAEEFDGRAVIGKYNVEEEGDLSNTYRIMSLPTILFFKGGERVGRLAGSQSYDKLKAEVEKYL